MYVKILTDDEGLEQVSCLKYLGSILTRNGD